MALKYLKKLGWGKPLCHFSYLSEFLLKAIKPISSVKPISAIRPIWSILRMNLFDVSSQRGGGLNFATLLPSCFVPDLSGRTFLKMPGHVASVPCMNFLFELHSQHKNTQS